MKMEGQLISYFKAQQQRSLQKIKECHEQIKNGSTPFTELQKICTDFLLFQKYQLKILEEKRRIHMVEKGKVNFRLVAEERVTVSFLRELYGVFAEQLESFIEQLTSLEVRLPGAVSINSFRLEAIDIGLKMLKISLVLKAQPDSTNYDKNKNPIPDVVCLGGNFLSQFILEENESTVTIVSESDLYQASKENKSFENVNGLRGVTVRRDDIKKSSSKKSKTRSKREAVEINFGSWSIPKDQLSVADKGSAHKDWVRLKFMIKIRYQGSSHRLWLLSLPFNIRKGSVQMYTFIGALMWYFYTTPDPYKDFNFPSSLTTSDFLKMLITRLEVIGRRLSPVARAFFHGLLLELSSDRMSEKRIELETVTRGPPSTKKKQDQTDTVKKTPTVSQTIDTYGFFTWFYALVYSLETSGYLHGLWLEGYIYDLCGPEYAMNMVERQEFGYGVVIIRPSMSSIYNHQGTHIHMGFSLFYKRMKSTGEITSYSLNQEIEDLTDFGLYECLTFKLPLELIYMSNATFKSISELKPQGDTTEQMCLYHKTTFRKKKGSEIAGMDAIIKHCNTCRCHNNKLNSPFEEEIQVKKPRYPSGNSDIVTTSDLHNENLFHKATTPQSSPSGSQMTCSAAATPPSSLLGNYDYSPYTDASYSDTDNYMSPDESRISHFEPKFPVTMIANRGDIITRFYNAAKHMLEICSEETIENFTQKMLTSTANDPSQISEIDVQLFDTFLNSAVVGGLNLDELNCVEEDNHRVTSTTPAFVNGNINNNNNNNCNNGCMVECAQLTAGQCEEYCKDFVYMPSFPVTGNGGQVQLGQSGTQPQPRHCQKWEAFDGEVIRV